MKGYGNLSLRSVKTQKELQMHFISRKTLRKLPGFVIYSYLKDSALTAVKRDEKFLTRYVKGVPFVNRRYAKGVSFLSKMVYKRVRS